MQIELLQTFMPLASLKWPTVQPKSVLETAVKALRMERDKAKTIAHEPCGIACNKRQKTPRKGPAKQKQTTEKNHENSANDRKNRNNRKEAVANKPLHSSKNAIANPNKLQRAAPLAIVKSQTKKNKNE